MIKRGLLIIGILHLLNLPAPATEGEPPLQVRLLASNTAPFAGEEVILTMELCYRGRPSGRPVVHWPALDSFTVEDLRALPPRREDGSARIIETERRALRPLTSGRYTIGGGVSLGDLFIAAPALTLRVHPLPDKGRPSVFEGAVGRAELQLVADGTGTREVEVILRGNAPLGSFPSPSLETGRGERIVPLGEEFSGSAGEVRVRAFRYLYLPGEGRRGKLSASISLFDPVAGSYRLLRTSRDPNPGVRPWMLLSAGAALLGGACLLARGRKIRPRSLEAILEHLLGRSPAGLCRERIVEELSRSGIPPSMIGELAKMWEMEDRVRFGGQQQAKSLSELRIRVAARLRIAVDKSRSFP